MPDEPAGRSLTPESGPRALMCRCVGFKPPEKNGAWEARGSVFGSGALRKVADLLFALLMMWLVSENIAGKKVAGKYPRKNVDGDEGFLTTIWLTGKLWKMEKVTRMTLDGFPELITRINQKE